MTSAIGIQAPHWRVNARLAKLYRYSALGSIVLVALFSAVQIVGWGLAIDWIKHPFPGEPAMPSGAAILFLIAASCALLMWKGKADSWTTRVGQAMAVCVSIAGGANYLDHLLGLDWPLDNHLFEPVNATPLTFPGPMFPDVSFYFILLGASLFFYGLRNRFGYKLFQILALIVGVPNLLICLCDFNGMGHICAIFGCLKFSPVTSSAFVAFCFGLLCSKPEEGITNIAVRDTTAGKLFRRICAGSLLLCTLMPFFRNLTQLGVEMKLFDGQHANDIAGVFTGIFALLIVGVFVAWSLTKFDTDETEKTKAEVEKTQAVEALDSVLNQEQIRNYKHVCMTCAREFDETVTECPDDQDRLVKIPDTLRPGKIFAERYEIVRVLGAGGMSTVYLTKHLLMNKFMAMKLLHDHLCADVKSVQRFQREAQAVTLLSHPNLLAVHDFGISPDGMAYLVMDYLEGLSLQEAIKEKGPMKWEQASELFLQLCLGLNHAHIKGIIHRDLKPGNVMLLPSDDSYIVKIVDFGFAKMGDAEMQRLTRTGEIFGSPLYMCPEQCQGLEMDHRGDIYAVGCIMYETLSAQPPFYGATIIETLKKQLSEAPPPFADELNIPSAVSSIVMKALEKDPDKRFQSAAELSESITSIRAARNLAI